jgi:hypothetical protein
MSSTWAGGHATTAGAPRRRVSDRLARYGWIVLLVSIAVGLVGGVVIAVVWRPSGRVGGLPGLQDLPWIVSMLGYGLVILLGLPSLLAAVWDFLRSRWGAGGGQLLASVGPMLFVAGTEIFPHLLNPCFLALELDGKRFPGTCDYGEWGADFGARWHLLDHTLVGAIPFAALYWLALRKWRPDIARFRSPFRIRR